MIDLKADVSIIGAGPAGLAAALSAKENGAKNIIVIDRNSWIGGILPQCIHDGFGIEETGSSMTGPEYAHMYIKNAKNQNITFMKETMVLDIINKKIIAVNTKGLLKIKSKSIVFAMGCREKTRWNILVPGDRPSGIYTAGVAQAFINLYNIMPGKNVIIVGSGDVGLIIARRLKFEGANVLGVVEILPYASGLPRNVVQCLDDYDIPLFLNHTIIEIKGKQRLESVTIAQVDKKGDIIIGSERKILCDTLLLSLGLIPENELANSLGIRLDSFTGGPVVNQKFETNYPGIFSCGNSLQVYDTVDVLTIDAKKAGKNASLYAMGENNKDSGEISVKPGAGVRYVIPQKITEPGKIHFTLRVIKPSGKINLKIVTKKSVLYKKKLLWTNPANMVEFDFEISDFLIKNKKDIEVFLDEKK